MLLRRICWLDNPFGAQKDSVVCHFRRPCRQRDPWDSGEFGGRLITTCYDPGEYARKSHDPRILGPGLAAIKLANDKQLLQQWANWL